MRRSFAPSIGWRRFERRAGLRRIAARAPCRPRASPWRRLCRRLLRAAPVALLPVAGRAHSRCIVRRDPRRRRARRRRRVCRIRLFRRHERVRVGGSRRGRVADRAFVARRRDPRRRSLLRARRLILRRRRSATASIPNDTSRCLRQPIYRRGGTTRAWSR